MVDSNTVFSASLRLSEKAFVSHENIEALKRFLGSLSIHPPTQVYSGQCFFELARRFCSENKVTKEYLNTSRVFD